MWCCWARKDEKLRLPSGRRLRQEKTRHTGVRTWVWTPASMWKARGGDEHLQSQCRGGGDLRIPGAHWLASPTKQASLSTQWKTLSEKLKVPRTEWCVGQFSDLCVDAHTPQRCKPIKQSHSAWMYFYFSLVFFLYCYQTVSRVAYINTDGAIQHHWEYLAMLIV